MPPELLACQGAPWPPEILERQSEVAGFILNLAASGMDCRFKLAAVRGLLNAPAPEVIAGPDVPAEAETPTLPEPGTDDGNGGGW